jgi:hypothetical protein
MLITSLDHGWRLKVDVGRSSTLTYMFRRSLGSPELAVSGQNMTLLFECITIATCASITTVVR